MISASHIKEIAKKAGADMCGIAPIERMKNAHPELTVFNGYDEMLLSGLSAGADGGIGSTYNVLTPAIRGVYDSFRAGDQASALKYQHIANNMIAVICRFGVFQSLRVLLSLEGMDFGLCREPFMPASEEAREALTKAYAVFNDELARV